MNKKNITKLKKINSNDYFNIQDYKKILKVLKSKYHFCKFNEKKTIKYKLYLRHDIDFTLTPILEFLKVYKQLNIKANFFIMISNQNYNILTKKNLRIINKIQKNSHCIGLHLEETKNLEKDMKINYNYFKNFFKLSKIISIHVPTNKTLFKSFNNFSNTYERKYFNIDNYASDSGRKVSFLEKIIKLIEDDQKKIQLLIHPMWWFLNKKKINKFMIYSYKKDYLNYIKTLKLNFKL
jgi:hypothetical protein